MSDTTISQKPEWLSAINEALKKNVQDILAGKINDATARCNVKAAIIAAGYHPGTAHIEPQSPDDLLCDSRLNLVIRTNVEMAQGHRDWKHNQDAVLLNRWPAQELFRAISYEASHDWIYRWRLAGSKTGDPIGTGWTITPDERLIALKNHDIWNWIGSSALFGDALDFLWPPFAFNSGMRVEDIDREETEAIGLITRTGAINPHKILPLPPLLPIESERITEFLWNEPTPCDHCDEKKPLKLLKACDDCGELICPGCAAKGCTSPE